MTPARRAPVKDPKPRGGRRAPAAACSDDGGALSQGQLLFFAHAVLADPAILDEATSNIDTRMEAVVRRALKELLAGRTSVVTAHRLSPIRDADEILVVEDGRIAESGAHAELLAEGGF